VRAHVPEQLQRIERVLEHVDQGDDVEGSTQALPHRGIEAAAQGVESVAAPDERHAALGRLHADHPRIRETPAQREQHAALPAPDVETSLHDFGQIGSDRCEDLVGPLHAAVSKEEVVRVGESRAYVGGPEVHRVELVEPGVLGARRDGHHAAAPADRSRHAESVPIATHRGLEAPGIAHRAGRGV
jgi:hypothetical protein